MVKGNGLNEVQCFYFNSYGSGTKEVQKTSPSLSENSDEAQKTDPVPPEDSGEVQETNSVPSKNTDELQETDFSFNFSDIEK